MEVGVQVDVEVEVELEVGQIIIVFYMLVNKNREVSKM
jgi:hypothetical protein